ncbi:hypothetical protein [Mucilaginibacter sp. KACC 22063]|uniref:hypothetical protein n=1 Tax=Mucilaginibacter sp. KACC 22063 TaxID=3025666 RepID=UPI0023664611|nr:hypothetical protein [Mucilaginibacter sp. KACC 22063]WDF56395.1 hypothetical protein PQ461_04935 [Mucilaginibacter sp. KACC 22063]
MGETSTTTLNVINNQEAMENLSVIENLDADELMFYHAIRTDLDKLRLKPNLQTIHNILAYSKSLR